MFDKTILIYGRTSSSTGLRRKDTKDFGITQEMTEVRENIRHFFTFIIDLLSDKT